MTECDRCHGGTRTTILAYWGEVLCPHCAGEAAEMNDLLDKWPAEPWAQTEGAA